MQGLLLISQGFILSDAFIRHNDFPPQKLSFLSHNSPDHILCNTLAPGFILFYFYFLYILPCIPTTLGRRSWMTSSPWSSSPSYRE